MNRRLLIFMVVFAGMNLAFIPLLSLYGLRVCPVLSVPGFGFGCYYSAIFVLTANIVNFCLLALARPGARTALPKIFQHRLTVYAGSYLLATIFALIILQIMLHQNHLTSHSRAPEILGLASLLLGITQAYGLEWSWKPAASDKERDHVTFRVRWAGHVLRTLFPVAVVAGVLLHFLISQSIGFNGDRTAPLADHESLIVQTAYVVIFLMGWLLITFTFHFSSELDQVGKVQAHLDRLHKMDAAFRSTLDGAWGLWAAILGQLNGFSKILGERTRLLNSFSRFVTVGVAERALGQDLNIETGTTRELTVLMSDIRNFTNMSAVLSPEQVVTLLNKYFGSMLDLMAGYQIQVDKFIGDGILAYVDTESVSDARSENQLGVAAAVAMIDRVRELNLELDQMGLPALKIGVGVYRGPLVIGLIGSEAKLQHTIIGDTVNRAARLEGLCKELGTSVVIAKEVWESLEAEPRQKFRSFGLQTVKGIAAPMEVYGFAVN